MHHCMFSSTRNLGWCVIFLNKKKLEQRRYRVADYSECCYLTNYITHLMMIMEQLIVSLDQCGYNQILEVMYTLQKKRVA